MMCGDCPFSFVCYSGNMGVSSSGGTLYLCNCCNNITYFATRMTQALDTDDIVFYFRCAQRKLEPKDIMPKRGEPGYKGILRDIHKDPMGKGKVFISPCLYCDPETKREPCQIHLLDSGCAHEVR
ncbi:MAG: hypothetical protein ACYTEQ_15650 [Planctomycetota bacterium]|jgi:hypothetical protein